MDPIRTSQRGWLTRVAKAYQRHEPIDLVDDADIGVDPQIETLLGMGQRAGLSPREWAAVGISLGMGLAGGGMVLAAILDPEPTSKLGLLVGGGVLMAVSGGTSAVAVLTHRKPPTVVVRSKGVIEIRW